MSGNLLVDSHGRVLRDLRVSITDRCNFRCLYCLPETEAAQNFYRGRWAQLPHSNPIAHEWQPRSKMLTFEEIERLVRVAVGLGIQKVRLTGGEPLLRRNVGGTGGAHCQDSRHHGPGADEQRISSSPNSGRALREAGLRRITFSLDSPDRANFQKITGRDGLAEVLGSIRLARELGMQPVKVNAVIIRTINEHEIEALADFAREEELAMRFIEFMPLDSAHAWQKELVVTGREILQRLQKRYQLRPAPAKNASETATRWLFADGGGEIGLISPVSEPFCGHCNRIRVTADGKVRTCLFSVVEHDLRSRLHGGDSDEAIGKYLQSVVWQKEERHHIGEPEFVAPPRSMSCIGG